jgi:hypothetical protein
MPILEERIIANALIERGLVPICRHTGLITLGTAKIVPLALENRGGNAGGTARIEIFSFSADFREKDKVFPLFYLPPTKTAMQSEILPKPVWEQGVGCVLSISLT